MINESEHNKQKMSDPLFNGRASHGKEMYPGFPVPMLSRCLALMTGRFGQIASITLILDSGRPGAAVTPTRYI